MSYASGTDVPVEKSKAELERLLMRYGASSFVSGWQGTRAVIQFEARGRRIQFELTMPDREDAQFHQPLAGPAHRGRGAQGVGAGVPPHLAKLEAVETGITTFEDEFLAHTVVPGRDGRPTTVGQFMRAQVDAAYESGAVVAGLLPELTAGGA